MKIAVLNNAVPFVRGGAESLADWLTERLRARGFEAILLRIPFRWDPPERILDSLLACHMMRLRNCDRVIALKFPVYSIPHDNKVVWLLHQFRQAYDLWGTPLQFLPDGDKGKRIRDIIRCSDTVSLSSVRAIYTNSRITSERLMKFNQLPSEVLFPPLQRPEQYHCEAYEDYIFCPSRMNDAKRQHLLVEAMRYTKTPVRLVLAGHAEDPAYLLRLQERVERCGLSHKVRILGTFIPDEEKVELFSRALACAYIPYDEDSYGYVTMEAFESRKPVITCTDAGGIDILVRNGQTGAIVAPRPETLAEAMDVLYLHPKKAKGMGQAGRELLRTLNIDWDNVVQRLTA